MGSATAEQLKAVRSFAEFYPIYLGEHADRACRPLYSLMGDWVMYRDVWLGRVKI